MPLFATNNSKEIIDADIVDKVIALCEWQLKIRELMTPIEALNAVAELEERIRRTLRAKGGSLKERDLQIAVHAHRSGLHFHKCATDNLIQNRETERHQSYITLLSS